MLKRLRNILLRFGTAPGRKRLLHGAFFRTWRLSFKIAAAYRRCVVRTTRIVVVVGSFGKTTTTRVIHSALDLPGRIPRGWNSGGFLAAELLRIRPGQRYGVLEVGISCKKTMVRCARFIKPDIVVVTSIGSEHHQSLGTLEATRHEKADMVRALPLSGLAVLNGDDPNVRWMGELTRARVLTFGFGESCDVRASAITLDIRTGMCFSLHANGKVFEMSSRLVGRHQLYSFLAAITVVVGENLPLVGALQRLQRITPAPGRLEVMALKNNAFLLLDSFKSIQETIATSLDTLAELQADRKIVVMGDIEEPFGPQGPLYSDLGARIARIAERVVFVGGEKAFKRLVQGVRASGMPRENVIYAGHSPKRAADIVQEDLHAGDLALIKGRSTQQLERVAFLLAGYPVPCDIAVCELKTGCADCPLTKHLRLNEIHNGR